MDRRQISPGFVQDALDCLRARGIDPGPILAAADLPVAPDRAITNQHYGRLWHLTAAALQDEFFGLAARPMRPGSFALMGHAVLHAHDLGQALRRALRFLNVVLDDPRGMLQLHGTEAVITLSDAAAPRPAFAYRTYWLILMGLACWLIGRRIPLRQLDFSCPAPDMRSDYAQFFGAPVRFGQPATRLVFDAAYLALPVIRDEAALRQFLREAPANILVRYRHDQGTAGRVRAHLRSLPPTDWPRLEALAAGLRMSPATLRRRLRADGQSYAAIKDELRAVLAERLLAEGRLSIAGIAAELGYSEPSAFHRAFRKRHGQSPRASALAGDATEAS
ncbi:MAG: AraC family transcriptional regulator [Sphingomonadales bacterium]|nr:AraC family transcriptional regulator [Sphingomonadales bacterium]